MTEAVPYLDLGPQYKPLKKKILSIVGQAIDRNGYILGPEVEAFEEEFASYCGAKYAVGVNSGTSAMHLALKVLNLKSKVLNLKSKDEVITTPFTFAATAWAISYVGARPVFVDIDEDTLTIDPVKIEDAITRRTKAVVPVHLYGHPCEMDAIADICDIRDLYLVEDACQAHGARFKGQPVGTFGNSAAFSFYPAKNLGACGDAGAIITDELEVAERMRSLRNHGSTKRYHHDEVGYNYRMDAIQAAILRLKLPYLDKWNEERQRAVAYYNQLLSDSALEGFIRCPEEASWAESTYHLYTIRTPHREELCEYLKEREIGYATHYPVPLHLQPCYKELGYKEGDLPVAEKAAREVLSLPLFPGITKKQIKQVAYAVQYFFEKNAKKLTRAA